MPKRGGKGFVWAMPGLVLAAVPIAGWAQVEREDQVRTAVEAETETVPGPPASDRDGVVDLEETRFDAEGRLPPPRCVTRPDGTSVCRRLVVRGRSQPAALTEAPWQVSLWSFKYTDYSAEEYRIKPEWLRRHKCGGTLIAAEWVLTAAHCLAGDFADHPFRVRIGSTSLTDQRGRLFNVKQKILHPGYRPGTKQNDIALLRIEPVRLPGVRPVRLIGVAGSAVVPEDAEMMIYGYGKTRLAEGSALLLKARIQVWPRRDCQTAMGNLATRITPTVLCALGNDGSDTCQGDSGGPMMLGVGPQAVQAGVVSWGKGCGTRGSPGVYAYVAPHLPWIWKATGGRAGRPTLPAGL